MFTRLSLKNFKSWEAADLELGRITGIFGTNSSGKTSLLQFLLLLKQTKDATDRALALELGGPFVALGTFTDFIHLHETNRKLDWRIDWTQEDPVELTDPNKRNVAFAQGKQIGVSCGVTNAKGGPRAKALTYHFGDFEFSLLPKTADGSEFDLKAEGDFDFKRTQGRPWQLPGPVKSYSFPDQARTYYQNAEFLASLVSAYELQMDRTYYLGPLREYPKREYVWAGSRPSNVGESGERAIEAILAATVRNERGKIPGVREHKPFQEVIAHWLRHMGLIDTFKVSEIAEGSNLWQARVVVREGGPEVLLTDVGFGVSQVLPVLTLLYYVEKGSTVILEQPEIHLHPLAQAGLADILVDVATQRNVQVIVESHSEHLLMRLQRRVAEDKIKSKSIKLYFADARGGKSTLVNLDVDLFGAIKNWPKNFMGDAQGELEATARARLMRRRGSSPT